MPMAITLAFDVYGTLIDTHGITVELGRHLGERAAAFSRAWREKQLEYAFRRGLMANYASFAVCSSDALDYTDAAFGAGMRGAWVRRSEDALYDPWGIEPTLRVNGLGDLAAAIMDVERAGG